MLWSRPSRAQPPIVDVAKCTFAAARMACASDRVIQSAAEGIGQSRSRPGGFVAVPDFADLDSPLDDSLVVEAAGATGDDPASVPDEPDSFDEPPSELDEPLSGALSSPPPPGDEPVLTAARRSFFAQPEPL